MKVCREYQSSAQPSILQSERPGHPRKGERSGLHAFNIVTCIVILLKAL